VTNSTTGNGKAKLVSNREVKIISEGHEGVYGGVAVWLLSLTYAPLKGQWFTASPASSIQFRRQTGTLGATVRLCISYHYSVTLTDKHNTTDLIYRFYFQQCNMFQLSTSAIIRVESVHTKNKKSEVSPNKEERKIVVVTTGIPLKKE
jgi:hypothetical protein